MAFYDVANIIRQALGGGGAGGGGSETRGARGAADRPCLAGRREADRPAIARRWEDRQPVRPILVRRVDG